jgi:hypothetical protein
MIRFRRPLVIAALALAGLVIVYSGLWLWEAGRVHARIDQFLAARAANGMVFSSDELTVGGFPFATTARFTKVALRGLPHLAEATLDAPELLARSRPWRPDTWQFVMPQGLSLTLPGAGFSAEAARGEAIPLEAGGLSIRIRGTGLDAAVAEDKVKAGAFEVKLTLPGKPPEDHTGTSLGFQFSLDGIDLPEPVAGLGPHVAEIAVEGAVHGRIPPIPLSGALALWRDAGGTVEFHHVALRWGDLTLAADGTLALDPEMQPLAAFSATLEGWKAILDALAGEGSLTRSEADFARLGLSMLARPGPDGVSQLKTPITLQNGQLYIEKARVARLPRLAWP